MERIYKESANKGGVYKITNKINNKVYYGSTFKFKTRWNQHEKDLIKNKHGNPHLQSAFNQHGSDNFVFEVIEVIMPSPESIDKGKQARLDAEQRFLDQFWDDCINCYNISKLAQSREGNKGKNPSPMIGRAPWNKGKKGPPSPFKDQTGRYSQETLEKIKLARSKQIFSEESKRKIGESQKGKQKHTDDVKNRIGEKNSHNMIALWQDPKYREHQIIATHHNQTLETREKISNNLKGIKRSPETLEKMRLARKKLWEDPEYKQRVKERMKGSKQRKKNTSR